LKKISEQSFDLQLIPDSIGTEKPDQVDVKNLSEIDLKKISTWLSEKDDLHFYTGPADTLMVTPGGVGGFCKAVSPKGHYLVYVSFLWLQ
jgi:hypothetical protein